jgi:hypothetical protein
VWPLQIKFGECLLPFSSECLLSKNTKAEMYKTAVCLQFLVGVELYLPH